MYWCWDQLVKGHHRQSLSLKRQVWYEKCFHLSSNMCTHAMYRTHEDWRKKPEKNKARTKTLFLSDKDAHRQKSPFNLSISNLVPRIPTLKSIEYQHQLVLQRLKPCPNHWWLLGAHFMNKQKHCAINPWAAAENENTMWGKGRKKEKKISYCSRDVILSHYSKSPSPFPLRNEWV